MSSQDKVILFGGSFDPVHIGHIEILRFVHESIGAARSILIPARRSPLKPNTPAASNSQRFDMLKLAAKEYADFEVSDIEFNLPEPSYSFHTISHFRQVYGCDTALYWLAGADVVRDLHRWYKIEDILHLCEIILACRGGYCKPCETLLRDDSSLSDFAKHRITFLETPLIPISSTEIRQRASQKLPLDRFVHVSVAQYISANKIYELC